MVAALVLWWIFDRITKWQGKRWASKVVKRIESGACKPVEKDPKNGVILIDASSVRLELEGRLGEAIEWPNVLELSAFKRDLFAVDLICIAIKFRKNDEALSLELNEDMVGWEQFIASIHARFVLRDEMWWSNIAFPAFATNAMLLWQSGDPLKPLRMGNVAG